MSAVSLSIAAAQALFLRQGCTLASITLLLYETCITADLELAYLWAQGRVWMIALFVTIRHVQLASLILNSIGFVFVSPEMCDAYKVINTSILVIPYLGWAVFLGWRAYALSRSNAILGILVFICSASFASPSVLELAGTTRRYVPATHPLCASTWKWAEGPKVTAYLVDASRAANLFAELIVLTLTCRATYREWRSAKNSGRPESLPSVLYKNGVLCFSASTLLHIASLVLSTGLSEIITTQFFDTATTIRDAVITVLLSRFILELAKLGARSTTGPEGSAKANLTLLTTHWTAEISDVPSQWTLDDEYNGRGFDKDIETLRLEESHDA